MRTMKARVRAGRLTLDEATILPEGTEVELLFADAGDDLDDADRAALHDALRESWGEVAAGEFTSAAASLAELRAAR